MIVFNPQFNSHQSHKDPRCQFCDSQGRPLSPAGPGCSAVCAWQLLLSQSLCCPSDLFSGSLQFLHRSLLASLSRSPTVPSPGSAPVTGGRPPHLPPACRALAANWLLVSMAPLSDCKETRKPLKRRSLTKCCLL